MDEKENMQITNVEEFYKKAKTKKTIKLPSGFIFEIRKINVRDYGANIPLKTLDDIVKKSDEKEAIQFSKMSSEQKQEAMKINNWLICDGVINPPISLCEEAGKVYIGDLSDDDYFFLLNEILNFSRGEISLKFFRKDGVSDNI